MENQERGTIVLLAAQHILAGMMANHTVQPNGKMALSMGLVDKAVNVAEELVSQVERKYGKLV